MLFTIPFSFMMGILIYKCVIRWMLKTPHHIQMIATVGMMIVLENIMLFIFKPTPQTVITSYTTSMLPFWGDLRINVPRFIATIITVIVIIALFLFLEKTILGKKIRVTADDEEGAMLVGIETDRVFMTAFAIASVLEGIAGSSITAFSVIDPFAGFGLLMKAFMVVVLTGLGNIPGAIVGGLIVGIIEALSAVFISSSLGLGVLFLILALVLIFKPSGIFGVKG
jgi:branched-chain amino acid transport system permease protein